MFRRVVPKVESHLVVEISRLIIYLKVRNVLQNKFKKQNLTEQSKEKRSDQYNLNVGGEIKNATFI